MCVWVCVGVIRVATQLGRSRVFSNFARRQKIEFNLFALPKDIFGTRTDTRQTQKSRHGERDVNARMA